MDKALLGGVLLSKFAFGNPVWFLVLFFDTTFKHFFNLAIVENLWTQDFENCHLYFHISCIVLISFIISSFLHSFFRFFLSYVLVLSIGPR